MLAENVRLSTVTLATGVRLHYAEGGDPAGQPLLFLHGWPDSWFSFSRLVPFLSDCRLLIPDQRGFGDSERPEAGYTIPELAADATAFLDALGVERVTVLGHSFGSFVARRVAMADRTRVERLALVGSAPLAGSPVVTEARAVVRDLEEPVPLAFAREFQAGTVHVPLPPAFFDRLVAESMKLPARLWRATLEGLLAYDDREALASIAAPVLLLWGEHDALFSREDQRQLQAAIPGARLTVYEDTGHCPNWERPERVAADLRAFLRER